MLVIKRIHEGVAKMFGGSHSGASAIPEQLSPHLRDGQMAERLAETYLSRQGLKIIARNLHSRHGEIDLVAVDGDTLVFVEVRLRSDPSFGGAAASIAPAKQKRIVHTARWFLTHGGRAWAQHPCRFDVVLFDRLHLSAIAWLRGAFTAD